MAGRMLHFHALSPVHVGAAQAADVIDLPVARERLLHWPYLPASAIKGVLRDASDPGPNDWKKRDLFIKAFGPDPERAEEGAGMLSFADAHLLCFPVRSYAGSFAWVTCPLALRRWKRDYRGVGLAFDLEIPSPVDLGTILVPVKTPSQIVIDAVGSVFLEDLDLRAPEVTKQADEDAVGELATRIARCALDDPEWQGCFIGRFGIVHDDVFSFLTETATEVIARIRLNADAKTVERGALWYEEAVPSEAIFACPLLAAPRGDCKSDELFAVLTSVAGRPLQVGGNATIGRGLVEFRIDPNEF